MKNRWLKYLSRFALLCTLVVGNIVLYQLCLDKQIQLDRAVEDFEKETVQLEKIHHQHVNLLGLSKLLHSDEGIEYVAREKLGLVQSDELTFTIIPAPPQRDTFAFESSLSAQEEQPEDLSIQEIRKNSIAKTKLYHWLNFVF